MESTSIIFLTRTSYFQWKSHMEDLLRSKGICTITLGIETVATNNEAKVSKSDKKND